MAGNLVNAVELLQSLRYTIHLHKEKSPSFNSQHKTIVGKNRNVKKKIKRRRICDWKPPGSGRRQHIRDFRGGRIWITIHCISFMYSKKVCHDRFDPYHLFLITALESSCSQSAGGWPDWSLVQGAKLPQWPHLKDDRHRDAAHITHRLLPRMIGARASTAGLSLSTTRNIFDCASARGWIHTLRHQRAHCSRAHVSVLFMCAEYEWRVLGLDRLLPKSSEGQCALWGEDSFVFSFRVIWQLWLRS